MGEELVIFTRTFDMLSWLIPKVETFPRIYRHTLVKRLVDKALDFQEALMNAQQARGGKRRLYLGEADNCLYQLKFYLRFTHHSHWLSDNQYLHISRRLDEIGKLLGGWIRQTRKS